MGNDAMQLFEDQPIRSAWDRGAGGVVFFRCGRGSVR